jgi:iron complex outermembrane recepter protein
MRLLPVLLTALTLLVTQTAHAQSVRGVVHDAHHESLPGVHVHVESKGIGTVTDRDGRFEFVLPPGRHTVLASMIGYRRATHEVDVGSENVTLHIVLEAAVVGMRDEIVVHAARSDDRRSHVTNHGLVSTERLIEQANGVNMIRRANYAWEPVVRGASDSRVSVRIDDMVMVAACVDRMDPVTSYVDTGNLERLEISRGGFDLQSASRPSGQINLVTRTAQRDDFSASVESEYQGVARGQVHRVAANFGQERWGLRVNASHRRAGDYRSGAGIVVDNSGFEKTNWNLEGLLETSAAHRTRFTMIGDLATDIGYPGLIMDTDRAESHLLGVEHRWRPGSARVPEVRIRLYHTRVDHHMSDYRRDVSARSVMPGMYMPMYGNTRTSGLRTESSLVRGRHLTQAVLEAYSMSAFADMHMEPTDPGVSPMYLQNVGGVRFNDAALTVDHTWMPSEALLLGAGLRLDASVRRLTENAGRRTMEALHPGEALDRFEHATSLVTRAALTPNETGRIHAQVARSMRLPGHLEAYGYYIYQPVDGFFHHGFPGLRPETSWQVESGYEAQLSAGTFQAVAFANWYRDYIAAVPLDDLFKVYQNVRCVRQYGFEAGYTSPRAMGFQFDASSSFVVGQNASFDEPLPLMPPLEASLGVSYSSDFGRVDVRSRHVAAQKRLAHRSTNEVTTPGFFVLDLRSTIDITSGITARMGVENLFDRHYHEHLSIARLPSPGRNVYAGVMVRF